MRLPFDLWLVWVDFIHKFPHRCNYCKRWTWPSQHPWSVQKKWYHKECYIEYDRQEKKQMLKKVLDIEQI